ncbi:DUF6199 family natural product biosynthesis protein [Pseudonocardia zijingensis]|jgi:hypothetical protein|uniref:DUF6199 domain-containing protein n=1 Tax=Pseudonocardia zijingensis TaxID=153376 RepID=A0ABN1NCJ6_9PSEU
MSGAAVFVLIMGVVMLLLAVVDQRALWRATAAWQYRNPEANEPSDAALALSRVGLVVSALFFFWAAFTFWTL